MISGCHNTDVDDNIQEIQDLDRDKRQKKELKRGREEDEKVILIKPYEELTTAFKTTKSSFIHEEIRNLEQFMKFIHSPTQTRLFKPLPYYQSLQSRGEQNSEFWKKVAMAFIKEKHDIEISRNGYPITIYQGGPPHKLYFIAINNQEQVIIGPNKKIVVTHVVGELKVLV